jgi:signal transduction histidine kinase
VGRSLLDVCPTGGAVDWSAILGRVLTRSERVAVTDVRVSREDDPGVRAVVNMIAFPVPRGDQLHVALVLRDVTAQRRSEAQLRRTEAMAATVTLARGVAHDFSSLLTTAIGSLSVASAELGNGRPGELVKRAMRACGQAAGLSRTLLTFAGGERGEPEALPLRETVELIMQSLDEAQLRGIRVELALEDVCALIDRDQFTEIVLNLVRNACEAMPEGGVLTISLEPAKLPDAGRAEGPPTHALLTVSDTGAGISEDTRERLFEPFFTTKAQGTKRSRGMGLSVVYAAVKNAGGVVEVQSAEEAGATFRVWLPFPE